MFSVMPIDKWSNSDMDRDIQNIRRQRAIDAFNKNISSPNTPLFDALITPYNNRKTLQWNQFSIRKGIVIQQVPSTSITLRHWYHRAWDKIKAVFIPKATLTVADAYKSLQHYPRAGTKTVFVEDRKLPNAKRRRAIKAFLQVSQ